MTSSRQTPFLSDSAKSEAIPPQTLAYFQGRLRNRLFDYVLRKFLEKEKTGLTKAKLARRIGRKPEVISRLLGAPGNWSLDTVSDLLLGIAEEELQTASQSIHQSIVNYHYRPWAENTKAREGDKRKQPVISGTSGATEIRIAG